MSDTSQIVHFAEPEVGRYVCGNRDEHLKTLERALQVTIGARGADLTVTGAQPDVTTAATTLRQLYVLAERGFHLGHSDVKRSVEMVSREPDVDLAEIFLDTVFVAARKRAISPKGLNQKRYVDAIRRHDIVFGIGPAGTGKTYLAMAMALAAYFDKSVKCIILTRPAVEAGEKLGYLPGDLAEKVNPYLRPLHDAIFDMLDRERGSALMEDGAIEVAPLAFMRGRTLNDAFIILDEAQNATREQMRMFLTRIGFGSKAVVTGDITQTDLPNRGRSGLVEASRILRSVNGIAFCEFTDVDVVRHPLVQKIIRAYERVDERDTARADSEE